MHQRGRQLLLLQLYVWLLLLLLLPQPPQPCWLLEVLPVLLPLSALTASRSHCTCQQLVSCTTYTPFPTVSLSPSFSLPYTNSLLPQFLYIDGIKAFQASSRRQAGNIQKKRQANA
jgi:hypothetical protein